MKKRILSLDLGITSFAYSIIEEERKHRYRMVDYGVMMRKPPYIITDKGVLKSPQAERRKDTAQARLLEQKRWRIDRTAMIFDELGILPKDACLEYNTRSLENNKWLLRAEAIDTPLTTEVLFGILAHIAKHRGYRSLSTSDLIDELKDELGIKKDTTTKKTKKKSSSKSKTPEEKEKEKESKKIAEKIKLLNALHEEYGSQIISQTICRAVSEGKFSSYRNHHVLDKMIHRDHIAKEAEAIIRAQAGFGLISANTAEKLCDLFVSEIIEQDMPTNDMDIFGRCTYYPDEISAPKYSYLGDFFRLYKHLADLKISGYEIQDEDKKKIEDYVFSKINNGKSLPNLKYKDIRKALELSDEQMIFGKEDDEIVKDKKVARIFVSFFFISKIDKFPALFKSVKEHEASTDIFIQLAEITQAEKTPKPAYTRLRKLFDDYGISVTDDEIISLIEERESGSVSLSHRFIKEALPYIKEGNNDLDEVAEMIGDTSPVRYDTMPKSLRHLHLGKNNLYEQYIKPKINNHPVKSLASWSLRGIADLSRKYGIFDEIVIETTRDVLSEKRKKEIEMGMNSNKKEIDNIIETYKKEFPSINREQARKMKLLIAQGFKDIYTGDTITPRMLIKDAEADWEHIVPRALGGVSADYNLVIAKKKSNSEKGCRLPMDWLNHDRDFVKRVEYLYAEKKINGRKKRNLLAESMDDIFVEARDTTALHATSYLEKLVADNLKMFYPFKDEDARKHGHQVRMITGKATSRTRQLLGIPSKSRKTNFHHVEDAIILATLSRGWQNELHQTLKSNYGKSEQEMLRIFRSKTPYIDGLHIADYIKEAFEKFMSLNGGEEGSGIWYKDMNGRIRTVSHLISNKPLNSSLYKDTAYSYKKEYPSSRKVLFGSSAIKPVIEKMKIISNTLKGKWKTKKVNGEVCGSFESFMKDFEKDILSRTLLFKKGDTKNSAYIALYKRGEDIARTIEAYYETKEASSDNKESKEIDNTLKDSLKKLLETPITTKDGVTVRSLSFFFEGFSPIKRRRGDSIFLSRKDDNIIGMFAEVIDGKLVIHRVDPLSINGLRKNSNGILIPSYSLVYLFKKDVEPIQKGMLNTFIESSGGGKKIALFNPRYPNSKINQPSCFLEKSGSSDRLKRIGANGILGLIVVSLNMDGTVKSYRKIGKISKEQEAFFKKESGYGGMENS